MSWEAALHGTATAQDHAARVSHGAARRRRPARGRGDLCAERQQPPAHYHPAPDEHFEVLEGELHTRVDGEERVPGAGDTLDIERGVVHQMWNAGEEPARVLWTTTPAGRTLNWFTAIDALHREGRVGKDGMPGPLAFGVLLTEYRDVFRLAPSPRRSCAARWRLWEPPDGAADTRQTPETE